MMAIFILQAILSSFFLVERNGYLITTSWYRLIYADNLALNPAWTIFGSIGCILLVGLILATIKGVKYEAL